MPSSIPRKQVSVSPGGAYIFPVEVGWIVMIKGNRRQCSHTAECFVCSQAASCRVCRVCALQYKGNKLEHVMNHNDTWIDAIYPLTATTFGQSSIRSHSPFGPKRGLAVKCTPSPRGRPMGTGVSSHPARINVRIQPAQLVPISCCHISLLRPNAQRSFTLMPPYSSSHCRRVLRISPMGHRESKASWSAAASALCCVPV